MTNRIVAALVSAAVLVLPLSAMAHDGTDHQGTMDHKTHHSEKMTWMKECVDGKIKSGDKKANAKMDCAKEWKANHPMKKMEHKTSAPKAETTPAPAAEGSAQ